MLEASTNKQSADNKSLASFSKAQKSKTIGFLISYDNEPKGEFMELSVGRWLLTSCPSDYVDYILVDNETLAPLHAIILVNEDGRVLVLDQLSTRGTWYTPAKGNQQRQVYGELIEVNHGDRFRFGEREFVFCLVPF